MTGPAARTVQSADRTVQTKDRTGSRQPVPAPAAVALVPVGSVPGWLLRVVLLVAGAAAAAVGMSAAGGVNLLTVTGIMLALLVASTAAWPGSPAPLLLLLAVVVLRLFAAGSDLDGRLAVLVALVPLIHQLCGISAAVPAKARLAPVILLPSVRRYLLAVVPVEIALLVAVLVG